MATAESYCVTYDAYRNRSTAVEVYRGVLMSIANEVNLGSVAICLTLGPGEGLYEIEFLQKCTGNVGNLIAVEQDHESAERFRARLRESLPNVVVTVTEANFHSWKGPDEPVNVVLLFHVLYYYGPSERKEFLRKLHDRWMADGGFVVVLTTSRIKPGKPGEIFELLGMPLTAWEDMEADLVENGFTKKHACEFQFDRNFSNPDEMFLRFFQRHAECMGQPVTLDEVHSAIKQVYPRGGTDQAFFTLAVFQKTH